MQEEALGLGWEEEEPSSVGDGGEGRPAFTQSRGRRTPREVEDSEKT